jgi:prolyl oligopeptidase
MRCASLFLPMTLIAASVTATPPATVGPYPSTGRTDLVEQHFGLSVPDPYRWLEADVRTDAKVGDWVTRESDFTATYLATIPGRDTIKARLTTMWDYEKFGVPASRDARLFYARNSGLQNQAVLYVQDGSGSPRILIDPNPWSKDGATALAEWTPSKDSGFVAYGVQDGGTDWRTIHVIDVATGKLLPDLLQWAKFDASVAWKADGSGFFYARFPAPASDAHVYQAASLDHRVYFHRLGTPQSDDVEVYATRDRPKLTHSPQISVDGRWLVILSTQDDTSTELAALDLAAPGARPRVLLPYGPADIGFVGSRGDILYLSTDRGAHRKRIVAIDGTAKGEPAQRTIVPEGPGTIDHGAIVGGHLLLATIEDAKSVVRRYALDGTPQGLVTLPGLGSVTGFEGQEGAVTYYSFASFDRPTSIYRYDAAANASTIFRQPTTPFDSSGYEVTQIFFTSKDRTRVPMFVAHKRGLDLSHGAPTLLYGYGGFNVSYLPAFSVARLQWMEMGGVFVLANIRGGGEYGSVWHDAGKLAKKQNVFDDFIAAGEYLIKAGITTKEKLAIYGGSNGGLLVGAVVNQRPDLFAAAIPQVGVMDMLRFTNFTAGRYWVGDYGDPAKEADFKNNLTYSPYHNIRSGVAYPAILVTTADTDDRVVPGHSFKYAAALQAADIGVKPHLIRIETRAGHGSGKPTSKAIEEYADMWAFAGYWTGLQPPK